MKKATSILLALAMMLAMTACGGGSEPAPAPSNDPAPAPSQEAPVDTGKDIGDPVSMTFHCTATVGNPQEVMQKMFAEKVEELSGGNITIDCFDSGTLFNAADEKVALKNNDIQICLGTAGSMSNETPWLSMFDSAYLFNDYEHMSSTMNGEIGQAAFERLLEERNVKVLTAFYIGKREISLGKDLEVKVPADLKGINLRMADTPVYMFMGKALGANPTPIALAELYTALQTKAVDGQDNPLPTVLSNKFYEVQESIILTDHVVGQTWICVNGDAWNDLTETQQGWMMEAAEFARAYIDEDTLKTEANAVAELEGYGLKVYTPDKAAFAEHVRNQYLNDATATNGWDMDLYKQITGMK